MIYDYSKNFQYKEYIKMNKLLPLERLYNELKKNEQKQQKIIEKFKEEGFDESFVHDVILSIKRKNPVPIENIHKSLVEDAEIAITVDDINGNFLYYNTAFPKIFGYRYDEMYNKSLMSLVHDDDREMVLQIHNMRMKGKSVPERYEFKGLKKDGTMLHLEVDIKPLVRNDEIIGSKSYIWNVTSKKKETLALRENEKNFHELIENSTVGFYRTSMEGEILMANQALINMLGYTSFYELKQRNLEKEEKETSYGRNKFIDIVENTGRFFESKAKWALKNGEFIYVRENAIAVRDNEGKTLYYEGTVENITDLVSTEETLRETAELYESIFNNVGESVVIFDPVDYKIFEVNKIALSLYGYSYKEILKKKLDQFFVNPKFDIKQLKKLNQAGEKLNFESTHLDKAGNEKLIEVSANMILYKGNQAVLSILRDITTRKQLENEFHQLQKMEAVGLLAGGIAHDFNNILTVITGNAEMALMFLKNSSKGQKYLKNILASTDMAASLTRQILTFSRKERVTQEPIRIKNLILELKHMLDRIIGEDIILETDIENNLPLISADQGQFEQVLMNLCLNGADAIRANKKSSSKKIIIAVSKNKEKVQMKNDYVKISVTDTGIGVPLNIEQNIFEPFFTTKEKGKGTGLGLSTVYGIVTQNKGTIKVENSLTTNGASFIINWPIIGYDNFETSDFKIAEEKEQIIKGTETILIVEDQDGLLSVIRNTLEPLGYNILSATSSEEALSITKSYNDPIDLLFTDIILPGANGKQLAESMRIRFPEIKVMFMSGYTDNLITDIDLKQLDSTFLQKPFKMSDLILKIRKIFDS